MTNRLEQLKNDLKKEKIALEALREGKKTHTGYSEQAKAAKKQATNDITATKARIKALEVAIAELEKPPQS